MIAIRGEIDAGRARGSGRSDDSPLRNAPHTAARARRRVGRTRTPRDEAAFPAGVDRADKYWPPVRRIDGAYGDRNLVCACPPPEAFED